MGTDGKTPLQRIWAKLDPEERDWLMGRLRYFAEEITAVLDDMGREPGQRRPWGTPNLRRELISVYRASLLEANPKTVADDFAGFDWRTIENWPEWEE
jgi:hypothetical protein